MSIIDRLRILIRSVVQAASAHCDTEDGPVVTAGRRALATGNLNHALPWVPQDDEAAAREAFAAARTAADGSAAAEHLFLETLVRLHRAGEGAGFDGIKPAGTPQPAAVTAADDAIATGDLTPLAGLVEDEYRAGVAQRFATAVGLRDHDVDDVAAGRAYVGAYVDYVHHAAHHAVAAGQRGRGPDVALVADPGAGPVHGAGPALGAARPHKIITVCRSGTPRRPRCHRACRSRATHGQTDHRAAL